MSSMFYVKNFPGWERALRICAGAGVAAWALLGLGGAPGPTSAAMRNATA